jgi:DUF4097 and DUF4098 domain-containing protein YvlB
VDGEVVAGTSNGTVHIADVAGPVKADTTNGPVEIALRSAATGPVKADTTNGPITLTVGSAFAGTLAAETTNGKVGVDVRPPAQVTKGKGSTKVRFGAAGDESHLETTNGAIKVTQH